MINSLQITCKYDTSYNFGRVKYCIDSFFFKSKLKKSIYNDKENQYEKKTFSVKQRVYEFLFVSYSYSRKKYLQYVDDEHRFIWKKSDDMTIVKSLK